MKQGIGIGVIILNKNNEILLLLRNNDEKIADSLMHYEGQYTLPAGKVKYGEEFENAAIRKVKEETGLDIMNPKVICLINDYNEYAHFATIGLLCNEYKGKIDLGTTEEQVDCIWTKLDELPENVCKSSLEIIQRYRENKWYKEKGE